jgi:hypothetical protein
VLQVEIASVADGCVVTFHQTVEEEEHAEMERFAQKNFLQQAVLGRLARCAV